jgi:hypothetical protein
MLLTLKVEGESKNRISGSFGLFHESIPEVSGTPHIPANCSRLKLWFLSLLDYPMISAWLHLSSIGNCQRAQKLRQRINSIGKLNGRSDVGAGLSWPM